ncbi:hypothetical protein E2C01_100966 [Portunus trituberculatus]|uniref:Uncharacterized protein n=1 Tax=Portunus trituberculatus TaxID=210409 RepID=A0A5B7KKT6_PORTR|nr:hypothetical protein [Portunus trituberculatus]
MTAAAAFLFAAHPAVLTRARFSPRRAVHGEDQTRLFISAASQVEEEYAQPRQTLDPENLYTASCLLVSLEVVISTGRRPSVVLTCPCSESVNRV